MAALGAIFMWSFLAALTIKLVGVAPLFLTGAALILGGLISLPKLKSWTWDWRYIVIGTIALFSYQVLIFISLRTAPAVEVNLINYFWPLFIVLLAPVFEGRLKWKSVHLIGALLGFSGGIIAILHQSDLTSVGWHIGYLLAFIAAVIWASYSHFLKRLPNVSSWTMGAVCLLSGLLALGISFARGESIQLNKAEIGWLALLGFGPLGISFYLWSYAMKTGDPRKIGTMAYLTPVLSTAWLLLVTGRNPDLSLVLALFLVIAGSFIGNRSK